MPLSLPLTFRFRWRPGGKSSSWWARAHPMS